MAGQLKKPNKFVLLLSVIDLIEEQDEPVNRVYYDDRLRAYFSRYIDEFGLAISNRPYIPFFHLKSDSFWHLKPKQGKEHICNTMTTAVKARDITDNVEYAFFSEWVFNLLKDEANRDLVREKLVSILDKYADRDGQINSRYSEAIGEPIGSQDYEPTSLFTHEQQAIEEIESLLDGSLRSLSNVNLYDNQTNYYYEYDLIIVGRSGIYVVDLKHWSGVIEIREYQWRRNKNEYRPDPHINNSFKCKILKSLYEHQFVTYPPIWVESIIVLTNPEATVYNADSPKDAAEAASSGKHNFTFASISDLVSFLRRRERDAPILGEEQITAITKYLKRLNMPKQEKQYTVPGYETVEYLSQKPEYIEMLARPTDVKHGGLKRLRVFRFTQTDKTERERFRKIALNTLNAVEQISDKSYIHKVQRFDTETGDVVEISDWSETGTLRDLISESQGAFSLEDTLSICSKVAHGLAQAHKKSIIHRAVKPENILIENGIPKLMNFDLAFQLEDDHITVLPDSSALKDDGYVAPEVLFGQDIDESTDFFSLGVIVYQMLTGEKPFKSTRQFVADGGKLSYAQIEKLREVGAPDKLIQGLTGILVADRSERTRNVDEFLSAIRPVEPHDEDIPNRILNPGEMFDIWEIVEIIGQGKETQIYKARGFKGGTAVLKMFNYGTPTERINREIDIGSKIRSPYVVRYDATPWYWDNKRFCAVMEYVPGESLRETIEQGERPPTREEFEKVTRCLMEGIRALHENRNEDGNLEPIIHGDIKPDNIIITPTGNPVLIDLGLAGPHRIEHYHGTPQYIPPYAIVSSDREFSVKCDLYALGVTLWEWLFGEKPYKNPAVGDKPDIPKNAHGFEYVLPWLTRAVATEPEEGFSTIQEMWEAFNEAIIGTEEITTEEVEHEIVTPVVQPIHIPVPTPEPEELFEYNSFVAYLNTLTSVSAGNENAVAENQIASKHFHRIHVTNPVTDEIYKLIKAGHNVILTGNAGDGKTTIAVDVIQRLAGREITHIEPIYSLPKDNLTIVKDMSEIGKKDRALILRDAYEGHGTQYFIVSNTGTLIESFENLESLLDRPFDDVLDALEASEPRLIAEKRFYLLNIGQLDSIETACQVFKRMLCEENWSPCHLCPIQEDCPISRNVRLLQSQLDLVLQRIYYLYKRLYEYGQRLTMRQMTGHLAYVLTAGLDCTDISNMSFISRRDKMAKTQFFNNFFGDDGDQVNPEATKMAPVRLIRDAEFGEIVVPEFEREVWLKEDQTRFFGGPVSEVYDELRNTQSETSRRQIRRFAYFCGNFEGNLENKFITTFLNSPTLLDYLHIAEDESADVQFKLNKLHTQVLHILQEQFMGVRLPESSLKRESDLYITLKPPNNNVHTQMVLASIRKKDFELVVKPRYQCSANDGRSNKVPYLRYISTDDVDVELELDLPFLDYVFRRYEGQITHELSGYYGNRLQDFKGKLLKSSGTEPNVSDKLCLLRIRPDRTFEQLVMTVQEDRLGVV
ncbi:MAG TPA: protein kinase [Bacillota bacterium]|nr:protein kinase [Bacillota bacterium]